MKQILLLLLLLLFSCENPLQDEPVTPPDSPDRLVGTSLQIPDGSGGDIIPGRYIVVFQPGIDLEPTAKAREILTELGLSLPSVVDRVYEHTILGFSATIPQAKLTALRSDPAVAYVEPDRIVSISVKPDKPGKPVTDTTPTVEDPVVPTQDTSWSVKRVHPGGIPTDATAISSARLWIIDTGIDLDHPDLNVAPDGHAYAIGRNPDDENGHGTHVAGIAAAIDNNIGVIGVASNTPVVSVRVLDRRGSGSTSGVIAGVDYVAGAAVPGDVANMSLGGGISTALDQAVLAAAGKGIHMVVAAGNDGDDALYYSPARADGNGVYTIAATDQNDLITSWSNYGTPVDCAEPGAAVLSLYKKGGMGTILSGTSMAAPHAAGLFVLGAIREDGLVTDRDGNLIPLGIH